MMMWGMVARWRGGGKQIGECMAVDRTVGVKEVMVRGQGGMT